MKQHLVKIKTIKLITPDALRIITEKPLRYKFTPGQATDVSINKADWKEKKNPFNFTCFPDDNFLEFLYKNISLA